jgi:hypothetical protein
MESIYKAGAPPRPHNALDLHLVTSRQAESAHLLADESSAVEAIRAAIAEDSTEAFSITAHQVFNFLCNQAEPVFLEFMPIFNLVAESILDPPDPSVLLSSLELLSGLLLCPTPIITQSILGRPDLLCRLSALLEDDDPESLHFSLKIAELIACDLPDLHIRFSKVCSFPVERIAAIFPGAEHPLQASLLFACRFIADSERYGGYLLDIARFLASVYDPSFDPYCFFPVLIYLVTKYASAVRDTPDLMDFIMTRLCEFCCPSHFDFDFTRIEAVSGLALALHSRATAAFSDLAADILKQMGIDDLVWITTRCLTATRDDGCGGWGPVRERLVARIFKFFGRRCKVPGSDWVFSVLFDARLDAVLVAFFELGSFRLKRAVLRLARLVLETTAEREKVKMLISADFIAACCDLLESECQGMTKEVLKFLGVVARGAGQEAMEFLPDVVWEVGLLERLEELSLHDTDLGPRAIRLILDFQELLKDDE